MKINREHLPPSARELERVIGLTATLVLVEWRGGVTVWVPKKINLEHPLANRLGLAAARALADEHGPAHIEVPLCSEAIKAALNREIARRRDTGETENQVARDVGLSGRHVRRICARLRDAEDEPQGELFGS